MPNSPSHRLRNLHLAIVTVLAACAASASAQTHPATTAALRDAAAIRAELEQTPIPTPDRARVKEPGYGEVFAKQFDDVLARRASLIGELAAVAPADPRTRALVVERWRALGQLRRGAEVAGEIEPFFAAAKPGVDRPEDLESAAYFASVLEIEQLAKSDADRLAAVDRYAARSTTDASLPAVLAFADQNATEPATHIAIANRIIQADPDLKQAEVARGKIHRLEQIGKPFQLDFTDALTGRPVNFDDTLKGKVVVIDFWATWCGPCKAYVPRLKKLYDAQHGRGLEIVSISLDDAGDENLAALKTAAAKEGMNWHHLYAGNGFDSPIARQWGIDFIPQIFVIDRAGNLVSTSARERLEAIVEPLLNNP